MSLLVKNYKVQVDDSSPLYGYLAWDSTRGGNATPFNSEQERGEYETKIQDLAAQDSQRDEWEEEKDHLDYTDLCGLLIIRFHGEWEEDRDWAEFVIDEMYEKLQEWEIWDAFEDVALSVG